MAGFAGGGGSASSTGPRPEAPVTINGDSSGEVVIASQGPSRRLYIYKGSLHNRAETETVISLREGATGSIRLTANLGAGGGGTLLDFGEQGWQLPLNTPLVADIAQDSVDVNITEWYIGS